MFARLKRKHDVDEEPLVPHGLVWQATDEPTPVEEESRVAKTPAQEDNRVSPKVVEMSGNAKPQPQADPPRKLGSISPPLQWPSPNIQEIARHPDIHAARPTPAPPDEQQNKKAPKPVDTPFAKATAAEFAVAPPPTPRLILITRKRTASWVRARSGRIRSAVLFCGSRVRAVSAEALRALATFRTGLREQFQRVNVKRRFVNARSVAGAQIANWHRKSQSLGAAAAQNLTEWQKAAALRSRSGIQKSVVTVKAIDFSAAARSLQRARNLKVTVRIPSQDLTRVVATISAVKAPWNRARRTVNRDSRLWMSMAMAGLSALLALGFVTVLPRYQPDSSPNVVAAEHSPDIVPSIGHAGLTSGPRVASNAVASPTVQRPSAAVRKKNAAAKSNNVAVSKPVKPAATKPVSTKRPSRKTHNSEDDDYVAKDTYVQYGSNGKRLR
jgi:hypothetical protein